MTTKARAAATRQFFSRNGGLAQRHPRYEHRAGQIEMAEAVEAAIAERRHLIVEAGTGTGKTLAYLVPAILSGKRVVISTGTKNLQEQLFYKDIPFLQEHFSQPIRACYMKGRNNYVCRQKVHEAGRQAFLTDLGEVAEFRIILEWEKTTEFGDRAEIRRLPENSSVWSKVDARADLCSGRKCQQFECCFLTLMHQRAHESDIIIVNHHLFFADLALKDEEVAALLPEYDAVIFDEAHELEETAGQYFGTGVSSYQFDELVRDILAVSRLRKFGGAELERILSRLSEIAMIFFARVPAGDGKAAFRARHAFLQDAADVYGNLHAALDLIASQLELLKDPPEEVQPLLFRTRKIGGSLRFVMESEDESFVYWVERRGRGCFLQATPIEVSTILSGALFEKTDTVILTSATLAVANSFHYVRERLGVGACRTLAVSGTFDYQRQAMLYVPQDLPDPRSPAFFQAACAEVSRLLDLSRGRAFVLFTSNQQMRMMHDRISPDLDYPTLLQGTAPRSALLETFRATPHCVLFATASFWQGVDVPGEQLSCVIIDKLPFAVPSDPVVEARIRSIRERGGNPFYEYQIPQAAIALKQGFGRLIRSRSDRGVLALLDHRITRQRYGQVFFDSLPGYRFTTEIGDVEKFFNV
jgi:ATP-dependent DNA helicase DinG